jgi:hypothetical protein
MAGIVSEFFGISGLDMIPPDNLAELIPYLLQVVVALVLVLAVFKVISAIVQIFCNWRWFR